MHRLDGGNRHGVRGFDGAQPSPCHDAGHDVLQVVDLGGMISKLVVVVIKSEVEALDMGVQVLVGDRDVLEFAQTFVQVVQVAGELLELLIHTVRLVRDEPLRFVEILDHLLHILVIICVISNIVFLLIAVLLHLVHHQLLKGRLLDLHVVGVGLHSCGDHLLFSI